MSKKTKTGKRPKTKPSAEFIYHKDPTFSHLEEWSPLALEAGEAMKEMVGKLKYAQEGLRLENQEENPKLVFMLAPYDNAKAWVAIFAQEDGTISAVCETTLNTVFAHNWITLHVEHYCKIYKSLFKKSNRMGMFDLPVMVTVAPDNFADNNDIPYSTVQTKKKTIHSSKEPGLFKPNYTPPTYALSFRKDKEAYESFLKLKEILVELQRSLDGPSFIIYNYFDDPKFEKSMGRYYKWDL